MRTMVENEIAPPVVTGASGLRVLDVRLAACWRGCGRGDVDSRWRIIFEAG